MFSSDFLIQHLLNSRELWIFSIFIPPAWQRSFTLLIFLPILFQNDLHHRLSIENRDENVKNLLSPHKIYLTWGQNAIFTVIKFQPHAMDFVLVLKIAIFGVFLSFKDLRSFFIGRYFLQFISAGWISSAKKNYIMLCYGKHKGKRILIRISSSSWPSPFDAINLR